MNSAAVDPRVRDAAIDWMVRLQSGIMSAADHQALQTWRQASATNEQAWQRVLSLPLLQQPGAHLLADATARRALEAAGPNQQRRRHVLKCLCALGLLGVFPGRALAPPSCVRPWRPTVPVPASVASGPWPMAARCG